MLIVRDILHLQVRFAVISRSVAATQMHIRHRAVSTNVAKHGPYINVYGALVVATSAAALKKICNSVSRFC